MAEPQEPINVLILVTGSVAAIKLPKLICQLRLLSPRIVIKVALTEASKHFFSLAELSALLPPGHIYSDADEWKAWSKMGDPVLHIELRRWAHLGLIAPLDANTLGKISSGVCDNLVASVVRCWDDGKPLLFAPAMNIYMFQHPITAKGLAVLTNELRYIQIGPISKRLACGDVGLGAMAETEDIVDLVKQHLPL